jgi:hypothetical protein
MSPSESELRASLHAGEGDQVDVDAVLANARSTHRERRRNAFAIGGAVAAVLAVGGVITGVQLGKDDHKSAAGPGSSAPSPTMVKVDCPGSAPIVPQSFGAANGPLFPDDVTAIKVCLYDAGRLTKSKDVIGPAAVSYAQRFNGLPTIRKSQVCPLFVTPYTVAMVPVTAHGVAPTVVGKIGGCGLTSNGTGARNAGNLLGELRGGMGGGSGVPTVVPSHTVSFGPGPS